MKVGDSVLIEQGRTPGTIFAVVVAAEHMRQWNLVSLFDEDPVIFVSRDAT